jgi:hypothetical protein
VKPELKEALVQLAVSNERTLAQEIRLAIKERLEKSGLANPHRV